MGRVVVQKISTGARWASADPASGVWQKVWAGIGETRHTRRVGSIAQKFYPLNGRRASEFEVLGESPPS